MYNVHITHAVGDRVNSQTIDQNVDDQGVSFRIPILEAIVTRANTGPPPRPLGAPGFPKSVQNTMTRLRR